MNNAKFKIYKAKDNQFYYRLYADDLYVILDGEADREAYVVKEDCRKVIDEIRRNAADDRNYLREVAMIDEYYFVFVDENGEILAMSQLFESEIECECAIQLFKSIVPHAAVEEITGPCVSNALH